MTRSMSCATPVGVAPLKAERSIAACHSAEAATAPSIVAATFSAQAMFHSASAAALGATRQPAKIGSRAAIVSEQWAAVTLVSATALRRERDRARALMRVPVPVLTLGANVHRPGSFREIAEPHPAIPKTQRSRGGGTIPCLISLGRTPPV